MNTFFTNFKLIIYQLIFNMKYLLSNKWNFLFLFIPVLISSLIVVVLIPEYTGFSVILLIALIPTLGLLFSTLSFNVRNSTIYNNIAVSNSNKYNFNIAIFISMVLFAIFVLLTLLILLTIYSKLQVLETIWFKYDYENYYFIFFNKAIWVAIISSIEIASIMFSFSFFYSKSSSSEKGYYIIIIIFTILSCFFGGAFNSYFWPRSNDIGTKYMNFETSVFPKSAFIPSLLFPFYAPAQLSTIFGEYSLRGMNGDIGFHNSWAYIGSIKWQTITNVPKSYYDSIWRWNTVLILPMVWVFLFGSLGIITSKIKR